MARLLLSRPKTNWQLEAEHTVTLLAAATAPVYLSWWLGEVVRVCNKCYVTNNIKCAA